MFNRSKQQDNMPPENNHEVVDQEVVTRAKIIRILGEEVGISFGVIMKKYADGIVEYGTFDNKTGLLTDGIRVYPEDRPYYGKPSQRYEIGQFKNGNLFIGQDYNLYVNYGETITNSTVVVGRLRLSFSYDSDYREGMLDKAWIDEKLILETHTTYMSTKYLVNEENLAKLHQYLPALKEKQCASLSDLKDNYLRRSSEFVEALFDAAFRKELGQELSSSLKNADERKAHRIK